VFDRGRPLPEPAANRHQAERYLRAAAAQGTARIHERIDEALSLAASRGERSARTALERATRFSRFARGDLEAICDSLGATPPTQPAAAQPLRLEGLPEIPSRSNRGLPPRPRWPCLTESSRPG
jgi:hypothetical protein